VIKPADKGGAIVVWRRDLYIQEVERQLENREFYQPVPEKTTLTDNQTVKKTLRSQIQAGTLPSEALSLVVKEPKEPRFYALPKIHKPETPGRPIVSACSCPTELISEFIDSVLQPLVEALPTYVKDSNDALRILDKFRFPADTIDNKHIFSMDVSSLYTTIPHNDGLIAIKHFLPLSKVNVDPTVVLRLAELVLTLTSFSFGEKHFKQTKGVSMGTKMGPSYACLFMGHLEERIFQAYPGTVPDLFKRYIDDCFGAAACPLPVLMDFIDFVSSFHPSIKFTHEISTSSLPFLEINVSMSPNSSQLNTTVFYKPTDSHTYLNFKSSHPPATKNSIPYSQFLRLRRLCSTEEDFQEEATKMSQFFHQQNYPGDTVKKAQQKASTISREDALREKEDKNGNDERPVLTITFHPHNIAVKNTLLKNFHILQADPELREIFPAPPLVAYKRDTNLRDHLVHARLPPLVSSPSDNTPGTHPCHLPKCKICWCINPTTTIRGPKSTFTVRRRFTCQSTDVIYAVICSLCSDIVLMMYVGETYRSLADRGEEHLRAARLGYKTQVGEHFQRPGHCANNFTICCIWQNSKGAAKRKFTEMYFAHRLGTFSPTGLNIKS
jgi:hypothetical protein